MRKPGLYGSVKWRVTDIASPKNILSDVVRNGLLYSQEDVDASSNFVVLSPFEREEDGTISLLEFDYNDWPCASRHITPH